MLKKILIALVVIVIAFLGLVAVQPSEFRVAQDDHHRRPARRWCSRR